ncbi:phosphotransferase [Paenibacillus sp. GYB003]|uniref:phosphotransferase n=1 Tax=Paenibacillus sp. GYB003 TaxID=2994392 RepID=UPI002F968DB1
MAYERFRQLLGEPILEAKELDPGYSGHASSVWLVKTPTREAIVRSSRLKDEPDREFWGGCRWLFGIDPRRMIFMEHSAGLLNRISVIPAPRTLSKAIVQGKEYIVVEKMEGRQLARFADLTADALYEFGRWLAKVHGHRYETFGNLAGTRAIHKNEFHRHMLSTMERLVSNEHGDRPEMKDELARISALTAGLPHPDGCAPVLVDMDPSQFLASGGRITAIVDTEAYVIAPPELDFVGLEYVLDAAAAKPFAEGYASLRAIPDLSQVRAPYRFLYLLLGVHGSAELHEWNARPPLF